MGRSKKHAKSATTPATNPPLIRETAGNANTAVSTPRTTSTAPVDLFDQVEGVLMQGGQLLATNGLNILVVCGLVGLVTFAHFLTLDATLDPVARAIPAAPKVAETTQTAEITDESAEPQGLAEPTDAANNTATADATPEATEIPSVAITSEVPAAAVDADTENVPAPPAPATVIADVPVMPAVEKTTTPIQGLTVTASVGIHAELEPTKAPPMPPPAAQPKKSFAGGQTATPSPAKGRRRQVATRRAAGRRAPRAAYGAPDAFTNGSASDLDGPSARRHYQQLNQHATRTERR
jgi:hypothetical protein